MAASATTDKPPCDALTHAWALLARGTTNVRRTTDNVDDDVTFLARGAAAHVPDDVNAYGMQVTHMIIMNFSATEHIATSSMKLHETHQTNTEVDVADVTSILFSKAGDVQLLTPHNLGLVLENALSVPSFSSSLFSIAHACGHGTTVLFTKRGAQIFDEQSGNSHCHQDSPRQPPCPGFSPGR
ncbi:MAG: hypothetical protein BJ554DRAFT_6736 [Olpidium bornovanus]|uniref:Uncharacterized protein n=1 Tax=Olpidium bornovanus TaxID=278681 RepID=A0A8H7ZY50_9FUNG|nr:MAG: hypothetical protein BJ554DRAFT_6736 [Olpidium bornovanus]